MGGKWGPSDVVFQTCLPANSKPRFLIFNQASNATKNWQKLLNAIKYQ